MKGVAARYPAYSNTQGRPLDLEGRINDCRATRQRAAPLARESRELLALAAYVGRQSGACRSRPMPIPAPSLSASAARRSTAPAWVS